MNKLLTFVFFSFSILTSFSQRVWKQDPTIQKNHYEYALNSLNKNDTINAIKRLYSSFKYGETTKLGLKAKKDLDLLISLEKKKFVKSISGKWKLIESGTNWGISEIDEKSKNDEILIIDADSIDFYKKDRISNLLTKIKSEKINFLEPCYGCEDSMFYFNFSDNQIWIIKPKNDDTILQFKNDGYYNEKGNRMQISCGNSQLFYIKQK